MAASRLGRRIAWAVVLPAAVSLAAVDVLAVRSARAAERAQVVGRMEAAAEALAADPRFFLDAPLDAAGVRERLARLAGFDFVLGRAGAAPVSSLPPGAAGEALGAAPPAAHGTEVRAGGEGYLALRRDRGEASLLLLFPTAAVDRAGRAAALPILLASLAGLGAAAGAGLLLGERLSRPLRASPSRAAEAERIRRERLALLGEFATGVAHEIRNPLASMRMTLELRRPGATGEDAADLDLLLDEIRRLEGSVGDLLGYAGEIRLRRGPVDLGAAAATAAALLRRQAEHLGVGVEVAAAPGTPPADGDADRLRSCVLNLLLNAVQASPRGGRVEVRVGGEAGRVVLEVADGGPGIPEEVGARVFEPFFSGRPGGTGLGLAVTRRIAEAHGGTVAWRSGAGGTVFRLEVPALSGDSPPAG